MGNIGWADLPPWLLVGIVVVGLAQLSLQVLALVNVFRTPEGRLVTGRRWVWVAVILFGWVGLIAYFAAGRRPMPQPDPVGTTSDPDAPPTAPTQRAVDVLYGSLPKNRDRQGR